MARSHGYYTKMNEAMKQWRKTKMNESMIHTLQIRYEAEIKDAKYKINAALENNMVIPEHMDITGEIDKLICKISSAEDKLAVLRRHYVQNKADKEIL
jgi:hypothetical protein